MRIDVIDNFLMPDEVVKYQRKVKELTWNAFERDIFQQDNVLSGMIADLNPDWREEFDDKILTKAQELTNVDLWIGRAYMNAWKANEICLPHRDYNHTTCLVYMNIDVAFKDWRSLFVSFHSENVNIASTAITLTLDMEVYDKVKGDITSALGDQIKKHIKKQKLNFGS